MIIADPYEILAESTLQKVRDLSEGHAIRHAQPRRRITYQLTRAGRPLRTLFEVRNPQALPLGLRVLFPH